MRSQSTPLPLKSSMLVALFAGTLVLANQAPPPAKAPVPAALGTIRSGDIQGHMTFLASDIMKGRDTLSPEIRIAADYLATRLMMAGAEPVGDVLDGNPTYFAKFPLDHTTPLLKGTELEVVVERNGETQTLMLQASEDFVAVPFGLNAGETTGSMVFVGDGTEPRYENLDVKDKLVLAVEPPPAQQPEGESAARPRRLRFGGAGVFELAERAFRKGAAGLIAVHAPESDTRPYSETMAMFRGAFDRPQMSPGRRSGTSSPTIALEDSARDRLAELLDLKLGDAAPSVIEGAKATFRYAMLEETKYDNNVIGLFRGADPEKSKEVIIYSAHYDHVGVNERGEIFNGSDDNASGTSALLEIAQAFGEGERPARSVAFLWVSGEEKGLLGSRHFANNITLPEGLTIVGNINMDMVSRNDSHQIGITPSPKHAKYSTLTVAAVEACKEEGVEPLWDSDEFFFRTDSASFSAIGIPVVFFFSGLHPDYHRPSDVVEKADFEKAARIARVAYRLGWEVANASNPPALIAPEEEKSKEGAGGAGDAP